MKTYTFILKEKQPGRLTEALLRSHVEHLKKLNASGYLVICGPFEDNEQAIQILRTRTREEALSLFRADPFIQNGYYKTFDLHELHVADESNNWLIEYVRTKAIIQKK